MLSASELALDARDLDDLARELERLRALPAVGAVAAEPHGDLGAGRAAEMLHGLVEAHVQRRLAADLHDAVVLLHAGAEGGRAGHRVDDRELLIADRDDDAEAAELAARRQVHLLVRLGRQEHAVRVERVEHAVARGVLDLAEVDLGALEVLLHEAEDLAEARASRPRDRARCRRGTHAPACRRAPSRWAAFSSWRTMTCATSRCT